MSLKRLWFVLCIVVGGRTELFSANHNALLPRLFHLDDYERCLSQNTGIYCIGEFELSPLNDTEQYKLIQEYSSQPYAFNRSFLHRGYCLSSRCPPERNSTLRFEKCVNKHAELFSLSARLRTASCTSRNEKIARAKHAPDAAQQLFLQVVYGILFFNLMGTIYDIFVKYDKQKNYLITAWSVRSSWQRLTATYEDGNQRLNSLKPIQGYRVVLLILTLLAHAYLINYQYYVTNPNFLEIFVQRFDGMIFANGTSLIQIFVMLSSFLTAYNILLIAQKHKLSLKMLPLFIIKRVVRIFPTFILLIGYSATWWQYAREGPLISSTIEEHSKICRRKFWSHVFFVHNIVDPRDLCLPPSWFLAADMQLYIISCILTLIILKKRAAVFRIYATLIIISSVLCGVIVYFYRWRSMILISKPNDLRGVYKNEDSFGYFYTSWWASLPACFFGLFMAHLHFELQERKYNISKLKWFKYLHNWAIPVALLWVISTGYLVRDYNTRLVNAMYVVVERPTLCLIIFFVMFGTFNIDGPLRRFFSWNGWRVVARLSLPIMLCHWNINSIISARPTAYEVSMLSVLTDYLATGVITIIVSTLLSLFVEIPILKVASLILF